MPYFGHDSGKGTNVTDDLPSTTNTPGADVLPVPVLQSALATHRSPGQKKARIDGGIKVHWAQFMKRMGTGTAPSTSTMPEESHGGSSVGASHGRKRQLKVHMEKETDEIDEVVVDREWADELKTSILSQSERDNRQERPGGSQQQGSQQLGTSTDMESLAYTGGHTRGFCSFPITMYLILRWRVWPSIIEFFSLKFFNAEAERHFMKEYWFMRKSLAIWSSAFMILNWALTVGFAPRPLMLADKIFYYGVTPAFTFPILALVMYDFPRDHPTVYQIWTVAAAWSWGIYQSFFMYACGFYDPEKSLFPCGAKDFVGTFYYICALPTIAIFGLQQKRFPFLIGTLCLFGVSAALQLPLRKTFYRNLIDALVFHCFLLYVHYMRENAERRLFTLRDQLKIQFRATQKAQVNERKASDSKRRLTSYVFHEVRVPLNTALLATQNMAASGIIEKGQEVEFKALEGSLNMMSKVLNDVLDFNRMDSGRFESVSKPYSFHQVMRSLLVPLRMATDARRLEFNCNLDPDIDFIARHASYKAMGEDAMGIRRRMDEEPDEAGIVVGDEMRLRQIINNLASNACKFTPTGGKLSIETKLIWPLNLDPYKNPEDYISAGASPDAGVGVNNHHVLTDKHLQRHDRESAPPLDKIIVRVEVKDTGCGIPSRDMIHDKLFSAFNQTELGRLQGGKGTGLGLALVRQIVKRSGGRLGVRSKVGEGSTFWFELPLGVGGRANADTSTRQSEGVVSSEFEAMVSQSTALEQGGERPRTAAMKSIMEQGGLVEPLSKTVGSYRTGRMSIPVPSTPGGTLPTPGETSNESGDDDNPPGAPPSPPPEAELDAPGPARSKDSKSSSGSTVQPGAARTGERPSSIELPKPAVFNALVATSPERLSTSLSVPRPSASDIEPGLQVLVVDDDPLTRMLMKRMLTRMGCAVSVAENGHIALEMIMGSHPTPKSDMMTASAEALSPTPKQDVEHKYAIVFLDNQMPVLSGLHAVSELRRAGRTDFVVGVTGNALLSDQEEYLEAGADHVLTKPVLEKSLKGMLVSAQRRRTQRRSPSNSS